MSKRQKTGGRQKGTPNQLTMQFRLLLLDALDGELQSLSEHLNSVPAERRIELLIKMLGFVLPHPAPIDFEKADRLSLLSIETQIESLRQQNDFDLFIPRGSSDDL